MRGVIAIAMVFGLAWIALAAPAPELTRLTLISKVPGATYYDVTIAETGYSSRRSATWKGAALGAPYRVSPILSGTTIVGYRVTWRVPGKVGTLSHTARYWYKAGSMSLHVVVP